MVKIKLAFITDLQHIISVADATWKQTYAPIISREQIEYMYERNYTAEALREQMQDGTTFLLATEAGQAIGFAAYSLREDGIVIIPKLYVMPEVQRKSIGKLLLGEIERVGVKNKCSYIELNVNRKNSAIYFYKKMGFELYEKADIAYGKFWLNDYVLRKKISQ